MKRQWKDRVEEPTQESQNIALALGAVAGPSFLRSILDCYTTMTRHGGEVYIGTYREKMRPVKLVDELGEEYIDYIEVERDEPGDWHTLGFMFHYEHVAKLTNKVTGAEKQADDRLTRSNPLDEPVPLEPAPEDNSDEPAPEAIENADREALEAIESAA